MDIKLTHVYFMFLREKSCMFFLTPETVSSFKTDEQMVQHVANCINTVTM
mgnify:FL=1